MGTSYPNVISESEFQDFVFTQHSLSELKPAKFSYSFEDRKEESLLSEYKSFSNGFSYVKHQGFHSYKDGIFSKKNLLLLTNNIPLSSVFERTLETISLGRVASSFYLRANNMNNNTYVRLYESNLREEIVVPFNLELVQKEIGKDILKDIIFTLVPIKDNIVELIANKTKRVYVNADYPYNVRVSEEILGQEENYRKQFEIDYKIKQKNVNGKTVDYATITLKATMKDGSKRFIGYNFRDGILRATGLMMQDINNKFTPYVFEADFVARAQFNFNYDAVNKEVKYWTDYPSSNKANLYVRTAQESNTHLLATCSTETISKYAKQNQKIPINIALTKTNFTTSGSYFTKQTTT
jgi:hypothetical protein